MRDKPLFDQSLIATVLNWAWRIIFLMSLCFVGYFVYHFLLRSMLDDKRVLLGLLGIWLVTAYCVLPRLHRTLTKWYIPNYFIGRVRTGDGLLGDPVNLALNGSKEEIVAAMQAAGWVEADDLSLKSALRLIQATLLRQSYPTAPVSSLYLFSRRQDLAFQQAVGTSTSKRHHVRYWETPTDWWLPGGYQADWLGAATYDRSVGISLFTGQITHKIAEDTDEERDYVVQTVCASSPQTRVQIVKHFVSGYHDRNGGGDRINTDGSLPFLTFPSKGRRPEHEEDW